jgi:hypothetical protein
MDRLNQEAKGYLHALQKAFWLEPGGRVSFLAVPLLFVPLGGAGSLWYSTDLGCAKQLWVGDSIDINLV